MLRALCVGNISFNRVNICNQDISLFPIRELTFNTCFSTFLIKHNVEHSLYINKGKDE